MCVDLAKFYHHCVQGLARGQLLASPLSKYEEPREWPELRMQEDCMIGEVLTKCQDKPALCREVQQHAPLSETPEWGVRPPEKLFWSALVSVTMLKVGGQFLFVLSGRWS